MINNRQQGRRRGRGNGPQRSGGGGQGQRDSGNRIDSRARGNAAQLLEKYKNMARDAQMSGDRVNTEYYLQFADHYFRVLADQRGRSEDQGQPRRQPRDEFDQFDPFDDFGDEGEPVRADEMQRAQEGDRQQAERQQNDRQSGDRMQNDRYQGDRQQNDRTRGEREARPRDDRQERPRYDRDERPREAREDRPQRQLREDRSRFDRGERRPIEAGQPTIANDVEATSSVAADLNTVSEPASAPDTQVDEAPRRRTRTRKVRDEGVEGRAPVEALDADRLPPSLGIVRASEPEDAPAANGEGDAPKPRRRRVSRVAAGEASAAE
ncbi:DUF4167 domain-containing protein [Sphingomonas sp. Mn802worker]|uniref:DUF4167 domain-containing protein n=1 Tax=Sphingomonas sp. Mn802worker TaxID=629773 RepID=UPI0003613329|nr:DUF4167 domain-containing protein [Sphingomonas sp. Mn802worker]